MGIKKTTKKAVQKVGDAIAKAAQSKTTHEIVKAAATAAAVSAGAVVGERLATRILKK